LFGRGIAYAKLGNSDQCAADFAQAMGPEPWSALAYYFRAEANRTLGRLEDAVADYTEALKRGATARSVFGNRADVYRALQQWDKAVADSTEEIKLVPTSRTAWYNRGVHYQGLGRPDKALDDHSEAIRLDPTYGRAWRERGRDNLMLGRNEAAVADLTQALELLERQDKGSEIWCIRAMAYQRLERWEDVISDCSQAIKLDPKYPRALSYLGQANAHLGRWQESIKSYSTLMTVDPVNWHARVKRAYAYSVLGDSANAAADLSELRLDPTSPADFWFAVACARLLRDDVAGYQDLCRDMIKEISDSKVGFTPFLSFQACRTCMVHSGVGADPKRAVGWGENAVAKEPKTCWYLTALALAHYRAGNNEKVAERCRQSLDAGRKWTGRPLNWLLLAVADHNLGHSDEARQFANKTIKWYQQCLQGTTQIESLSPVDVHPCDWLEFLVLFHETRTLLEAAAASD
jgi:tetratricopeptide (TPR) repeat protein